MVYSVSIPTPSTPAASDAGTGRAPRRLPFVLLASRSPRRQALLTEHDVPHEAIHPGFEDGVLVPGAVTPAQWVASLAYLKAWSGAALPNARADGGRVVIGADTACLMDERLIGTPGSTTEAEHMIRSFIAREHDVLTGVAMLDMRGHEGDVHALPGDRRQVFVDRARVRVGHVSDGQVREYLDSGLWQGKAGAYNLSERLNAGWPIEFQGDHTTIMGLPMKALLRRLHELD